MNERVKHNEKRLDARVTAEHEVHLMVSLHGFDPGDHRFEAKGITINVSHHGTLVRVNQPVANGSRCLVHLPGGDRRVGKTLIYGSVIWSREVEHYFEVAIEFDTRLQALSIEDSLDGV